MSKLLMIRNKHYYHITCIKTGRTIILLQIIGVLNSPPFEISESTKTIISLVNQSSNETMPADKGSSIIVNLSSPESQHIRFILIEY